MNWRNSIEARAARYPAPALDALKTNTADVIHRYVVGKQSTRAIGRHYRVDKKVVCQFLTANGVELRDRGAAGDRSREPDNRPEVRIERQAERATTAPEVADDEDPWARADRRHVRLICRGLNGKGLPFYAEGALRI